MSQVLRRLPNSRFSEVLNAWKGVTAVIFGGGPSLTKAQVDRVRVARFNDSTLRCIAVNDAYLWVPWADMHYAADSQWHAWHSAGVEKPALGLTALQVQEKWRIFSGQKCSIQNSGANIEDDAVHMLRNATHPDHRGVLSFNPQELVTGRNSGFQAVNLAVLAGAATIILLGFDAREGAEQTHWHGGHPRPMPVAIHAEIRKAFTLAEQPLFDAGVRVINCSPGSAIDSFEKQDLALALSGSRAQVAA